VSNAAFEVGTAKGYRATGLDFVTVFDCLHDIGDPAGAAAHLKETLKPDSTWMADPRRQTGVSDQSLGEAVSISSDRMDP
jgi:hypothetical protein